MTVFVLPQVDRWQTPDPQPHDLTRVYDAEGALWLLDPFDGSWTWASLTYNCWLRKSWHELTETYGPLTRYREAS